MCLLSVLVVYAAFAAAIFAVAVVAFLVLSVVRCHRRSGDSYLLVGQIVGPLCRPYEQRT